MIPNIRRFRWQKTFRLIRSIYPPADLFEDIASPADWDLIATAETKTNPRVRESAGTIRIVPPERRVSGPGAIWAMAPFCHFSRNWPSRFSDGSYGVYYAGDRFEVALAETVFHFERFMKATVEEPSTADYRELVGSLDSRLHVLSDTETYAPELDPECYSASQSLALVSRNRHGSNGIVYPSVRYTGGSALSAFWPDVVGIPVQGRHLRYRWNGQRADAWLVYGDDSWQMLR